MTTLRWLQPEPPPADYWHVYRDGDVVLIVVVPPDAEGVRSIELDPWPVAADYWLTAVNAAGESPPSSVIRLPEPGLLGLVLVIAALFILAGRERWTCRSNSSG